MSQYEPGQIVRFENRHASGELVVQILSIGHSDHPTSPSNEYYDVIVLLDTRERDYEIGDLMSFWVKDSPSYVYTVIE